MTKPKTHYVAVTTPGVVCTHKHKTLLDAVDCPDRGLYMHVMKSINGILYSTSEKDRPKRSRKPFSLFISVNRSNKKIEIDLSDLNIHNEIRTLKHFLTSGRIEMFVESMLQFYYRNFTLGYSIITRPIDHVAIFESAESIKPLKEFTVVHTVKQVFGLFENYHICANCEFFKHNKFCNVYENSTVPRVSNGPRRNPTDTCKLWSEKQ